MKAGKSTKAKKTKQPKQKHGPLFFVGLGVALVCGAAIELGLLWFFSTYYKPRFDAPVANGLTTAIMIEDCGSQGSLVVEPGKTVLVKNLKTYKRDQVCGVVDRDSQEFLGCILMPVGVGPTAPESLVNSKTILKFSRIGCEIYAKDTTNFSSD